MLESRKQTGESQKPLEPQNHDKNVEDTASGQAQLLDLMKMVKEHSEIINGLNLKVSRMETHQANPQTKQAT